MEEFEAEEWGFLLPENQKNSVLLYLLENDSARIHELLPNQLNILDKQYYLNELKDESLITFNEKNGTYHLTPLGRRVSLLGYGEYKQNQEDKKRIIEEREAEKHRAEINTSKWTKYGVLVVIGIFFFQQVYEWLNRTKSNTDKRIAQQSISQSSQTIPPKKIFVYPFEVYFVHLVGVPSKKIVEFEFKAKNTSSKPAEVRYNNNHFNIYFTQEDEIYPCDLVSIDGEKFQSEINNKVILPDEEFIGRVRFSDVPSNRKSQVMIMVSINYRSSSFHNASITW